MTALEDCCWRCEDCGRVVCSDQQTPNLDGTCDDCTGAQEAS